MEFEFKRSIAIDRIDNIDVGSNIYMAGAALNIYAIAILIASFRSRPDLIWIPELKMNS